MLSHSTFCSVVYFVAFLRCVLYSIPFAGVYINYINEIVSISNGGIKDIAYTHQSKASDILHPTSFTAAVQDIEDGLADMGVGPFWVTAERLKMVAFTVPVGALYLHIYFFINK